MSLLRQQESQKQDLNMDVAFIALMRAVQSVIAANQAITYMYAYKDTIPNVMEMTLHV